MKRIEFRPREQSTFVEPPRSPSSSKSRWRPSIPVSRMPTSTARQPA
jgi:hypothetical protein